MHIYHSKRWSVVFAILLFLMPLYHCSSKKLEQLYHQEYTNARGKCNTPNWLLVHSRIICRGGEIHLELLQSIRCALVFHCLPRNKKGRHLPLGNSRCYGAGCSGSRQSTSGRSPPSSDLLPSPPRSRSPPSGWPASLRLDLDNLWFYIILLKEDRSWLNNSPKEAIRPPSHVFQIFRGI